MQSAYADLISLATVPVTGIRSSNTEVSCGMKPVFVLTWFRPFFSPSPMEGEELTQETKKLEPLDKRTDRR